MCQLWNWHSTPCGISGKGLYYIRSWEIRLCVDLLITLSKISLMMPLLKNGQNGNRKRQNLSCHWITISQSSCDSWGSGTHPLDFGTDPWYITFVAERHPMFDELWQEIQDAPGEIFDMDIPELREDNKFDVNEYLNANYDYWNNAWSSWTEPSGDSCSAGSHWVSRWLGWM